MPHALLTAHQPLLDGALHAIATRGYWSPYSEMPSPKVYGETAAADGKAAFDAHLGRNFELNQPGQSGWGGREASPYGVALDVRYPMYGFKQHMGYPTAAHLAALQAHGPTPAHRRSFGPVAQCVLPGVA